MSGNLISSVTSANRETEEIVASDRNTSKPVPQVSRVTLSIWSICA